ncbi:MAG TPA: VWA domain-containing protein [Planctomycetota bacterium]|nr:VWA domain-containing protein [Planctomycetota bacterium]
MNQPAFPDPTLVENPSERCPVVLLLDTSGSMKGAPIAELQQGLAALKYSLASDTIAMQRVELAIVTFGPVQVLQDFTSPTTFDPPQLPARSDTPMGAAITRALELLAVRKEQYRAAGVGYYRPWIFLITDGAPTDDWQEAARLVHAGETAKKFMFFAVAVEGADLAVLTRIAPPQRPPVKLKGLAFTTMFQWLSSSLKSVSRSRTDQVVPIENPTEGPRGWASTT